MRVIGCFGSNGFDLGCGLRELGLGSSASAWENSIDHGLVTRETLRGSKKYWRQEFEQRVEERTETDEAHKRRRARMQGG